MLETVAAARLAGLLQDLTDKLCVQLGQSRRSPLSRRTAAERHFTDVLQRVQVNVDIRICE
ncbi:hypothetical protein OKW49_008245 [Paraburkholderia youngii]|uniref:hypothetical protein n=1 Tax=Paraburkholderia youngii TaxID=2782701 RepID=UPI003D1AB78C